MEIKQPSKKLGFDPERCDKVYDELVKVFQKYKPTVGEIIIAVGNLCYSLGASIGGYKEKGPSVEEIQKLYYAEPGRIDVSLMAQGIIMTTWHEDWEKLQLKKDIEEET